MRILLPLLAALVPLCAALGAAPNTLTPEQRRDGWTLLFDGRSTEGWRGFGKKEFPPTGWEVEDGWLHHKPKGGGGDILTARTFRNFELTFDWRIAPGGNSGVKYFIDESRGAPIGHEYQVIDDASHPDASVGPKRQTSALYDALPPQKAPVRKAGEINTSRILVRDRHVEHWLNGVKVLDYELGSPELATAKAASKFKTEGRWGTGFPTPILLQDHSDEVWFQNLRIRELQP